MPLILLLVQLLPAGPWSLNTPVLSGKHGDVVTEPLLVIEKALELLSIIVEFCNVNTDVPLILVSADVGGMKFEV